MNTRKQRSLGDQIADAFAPEIREIELKKKLLVKEPCKAEADHAKLKKRCPHCGHTNGKPSF